MRRAAIVVAMLLGALALVTMPGTTAAFTDPAKTTSGTFGAATLHAPTALTCKQGGFGSYVDITWTPTSDTPHWTSITDGVDVHFLGETNRGVATFRVSANDAFELGDGYLTVRNRAVAGSNWISADVATFRVERYFDLFAFTHKIRCA